MSASDDVSASLTGIHYETERQPPADTLSQIERGLHEHNVAHLGEDVINRYRKVAVVARMPEHTLIGGIIGEMFWDWLHIDTLWVEERYRAHGIGSELLARLERIAVAEGFLGSHLETTDFQAVDFYLRNGYTIFAELAGKPAGSTWYYMKKTLV